MFQRFLALCALTALLLGVSARAGTLKFSGSDSSFEVRSIYYKKTFFLHVDDVAARLPITVVHDTTAGLFVLCTPYDCVPAFEPDTLEVRRTADGFYIKTERFAEALNCPVKIKKTGAITFSCGYPAWTQKVGPNVDDAAPGFILHNELDSTIALTSLLKDKPLVLLFIRSGDWDPASRLIMKNLLVSADTIRMAGYNIAVIHGYSSKDAAKWQKTSQYPYIFLSDQYSTVMRAYHVFDRSHIPHPSAFLIDKSGTIRFRRIFDEPDVVPDVSPLIDMIKRNH